MLIAAKHYDKYRGKNSIDRYFSGLNFDFYRLVTIYRKTFRYLPILKADAINKHISLSDYFYCKKWRLGLVFFTRQAPQCLAVYHSSGQEGQFSLQSHGAADQALLKGSHGVDRTQPQPSYQFFQRMPATKQPL